MMMLNNDLLLNAVFSFAVILGGRKRPRNSSINRSLFAHFKYLQKKTKIVHEVEFHGHKDFPVTVKCFCDYFASQNGRHCSTFL